MAISFEVRELDPAHYGAWNAFTAVSPQGSVFATTPYLEACQADYRILACLHGDDIVGGIVLTRSKWGKWTNPLLCKYLGILLAPFEGSRYQSTTNARKVQQKLIEAIGRKRRFEYMFHPAYDDWLPFHWAGYSQTTKYTYRIDLSQDPAADGYYSRLRGKINKAEKAGGFELINDVPPALVFDMMEKTFSRQKDKNPFSRKWLEKYVEQLASKGALMLTALSDPSGKVVALLGIACDARTHHLVLNGVDHEAVETGWNEWLIDNAIVRAAESGAAYFDFEGSMMRNIESFYRQFGGELTPYYVISG